MQTGWRQGWVWASLVILAVLSAVMYRYGGDYFDLVEKAAMRAIEEKNGKPAREGLVAARAAWYPIWISAIGMGGLAIILWLMMFKPF